MDDGIRVLVLKNAVKYGGKANPKAVLGAVLKEFPEKLKKIDDLRKLLEAECKEINKLSAEEQEALLKKLDPSALEKKEKKERDLPVITSMKQGKVHTRIPPEPSKYIHIGHALSFLLNFLYAQRYKGSCLLRFEDANPEKVTKEYVETVFLMIMMMYLKI